MFMLMLTEQEQPLVLIAFFLLLSLFKFSDTAYVRVFISDVNDNKPVFAQPSYEVDVDEDADVGFAILTVSANDGDEGRWKEKKRRTLCGGYVCADIR